MHSDNEAQEEKGRSVNCPDERLEFQNFLIALLCYVDDASQHIYAQCTSTTTMRK